MSGMSVTVDVGAGDAGTPRGLLGRESECARLLDLLARVRGGFSSALVLSGEAGIGKSALLAFAAEQAHGFSVISADGVESEMELAYAGLHQLCVPLLDALDRIPAPQREALSTAFGLTAGRTPDRFLIGLAVLSLLSESAKSKPVLCLVDDLQWLDEASTQTISFVARRLRADPIGFVIAVREPVMQDDLPGLTRLAVEGLSDADASALLATAITGPVDDRVRERIIAETRGNPLALLQLPRGLKAEEMAGGFGIYGAGALSTRIEQSFRRRLEPMPAATRRLLLVAAAEPGQDAGVIWRAAERLGAGPDDAEPAIADGFATFGGQVRFCHPLARSTVYKAALADERRAAHRALAGVTDSATDPERRAWHRANAASGLDEDIASDLERSAGLAHARGGRAAAAAFQERAAELTPDPQRRAERALTAAWSKYEAGSPERALRLLAIAEAGSSQDVLRARAQLLRARVTSRLVPRDGAGMLLAAAERLEAFDRTLARETYRDAFYAAQIAGGLGRGATMRTVALATRASRSVRTSDTACDRILDGLATIIVDGYPEGAPKVQEAVAVFRDADLTVEPVLPWLPLVGRLALDVWDMESVRVLSEELIAFARRQGALNVLHTALLLGAAHKLFTGDLTAVQAIADEGALISDVTTIPKPPYGLVLLAAWRGDQDELDGILNEATPSATARGEGQWLTNTGWVLAVLNNGLGRYDRALLAAEQGAQQPSGLSIANWSMVELVEAAARSGRPERAAGAVRHLTEMAEACGTDWIHGVAARARALIAEGPVAETEYAAAIEHLGRTPLRTELARARLVYGEWLRRENRRSDARAQLRQAHAMLEEIGAIAFAERARRELAATGETVHTEARGNQMELTPQELQIARLAAEGRTNSEIATQLFVSPRTIEWHLRKIFGKLRVTSRRDLSGALARR